MADWFFATHGVRDHIEIELVTPLSAAFTKPVAAAVLGHICEQKNIKVTPNFQIAAVDGDKKVIKSYGGEEVPYDLLVAIPPNFGAQVIIDSGMGDPMGYVETDHNTLKAKNFDRVFVVGDAANVPTSKAGAVAHYEADTIIENLVREMDGQPALPSFDGHAT
ncbi:MAG TPA: hypothetical protein VIN67_05125, partial [Desulfobaccales bacterium]